jgi:putative transposase
MLAEWDRCRWVWNNCVARDLELRAEGERSPSGYDLCGELTDWRSTDDRRGEWLRSGSQNAQQNTVIEWGRNRKAAFTVPGRRPPKFKAARWSLPTLAYTTRGFRIDDDRRLVVAGGITLPVVWHRELPSEPTSVRVYRDAVGHWWSSFVVEREAERFPAPVNDGIGVDWGVTATATTTDPDHDLPHAEHGRRAAQRLARYQRQMARRKPKRDQAASKGYLSAKQAAAKEHARIRRQCRHDAIQWARQVVTDHETIAVEDFRPKFLARSTMARKAADGRIGAAKATLIEYGERAGRTVVLVPPAYTTMTCGECGATRTKRIPLHCRTFHCLDCGHTADRDRNAARTILAAAESNGASVDSRRHRDLLPGPVQLELESPRL